MRALLILSALTAWLIGGAWTYGTASLPIADPNATQAAQNVWLYLQYVGSRTTHRVVAGQQFSFYNCAGCNFLPAAGWTSLIESLNTLTGKYPGLVGADYNDWNSPSPGSAVDYTTLNTLLIAAWNAGSLVEISYSPANPWTNGSRYDTSCGGGTLGDIIDNTKPVYTTWHTQLARVATGLKVLQTAGVPVIWRPLAEQNTGWWWTACNATGDTQAIWRAVWADAAQTLMNAGVHNLLYTWPGTTTKSPLAQVVCTTAGLKPQDLCFYPGDANVDIIGVDNYTMANDMSSPTPASFQDDWITFKRTGKLVEFTEFGPAITGGTTQVYTTLVSSIVNNNGSPLVGYFMSWFDAPGHTTPPVGLTGNTNGTTTVTMAATTGIVVGMGVTAADIASGTTVASITPNTRITLSVAASGSNVGESLTFTNTLLSIVANPGANALMNDANTATQTDVKRALDCMAAATNYTARVACVAL